MATGLVRPDSNLAFTKRADLYYFAVVDGEPTDRRVRSMIGPSISGEPAEKQVSVVDSLGADFIEVEGRPRPNGRWAPVTFRAAGLQRLKYQPQRLEFTCD